MPPGGSTRVFKKSSPNGKLTTYLGKRDFIDHVDYTESIDGIVLIDEDYVNEVPGRKVLATLSCVFRYGREDLDVLGLTFRRDLYTVTQQIYPTNSGASASDPSGGADSVHSTVVANLNAAGGPAKGQKGGNQFDTLTISASQQPEQLTQLQVRLKRKLGENAYPLYFKIPPNCPCSVTLQPAPGDTGKPCGIDYELKTWVLEPHGYSTNQSPEHDSGDPTLPVKSLAGILPAQYLPENEAAKADGKQNDDASTAKNSNLKNSVVKLAIRKIQYAPARRGAQPQAEIKQTFLLSDKPIHMEATLDKDLYHHGEKIHVNVQVTNNSSKVVKKMKLSVRQFADICLYSNAQYKCVVAQMEADDSVGSSQTLCKVYEICPLLAANKDKRGLALDGQLKHEDTNLASSTIMKNDVSKEGLGIIVQYKVKVKAVIGGMLPGTGKDISVELPFKLMHSRPAPQAAPSRMPNVASLSVQPKEPDAQSVNLISFEPAERLPAQDSQRATNTPQNAAATVDEDLLLFEDFARMRALQTQNSQEELGANVENTDKNLM